MIIWVSRDTSPLFLSIFCPPSLSKHFFILARPVSACPHPQEERLGYSVSQQMGILNHMLLYWHAFIACSLFGGILLARS